MQPSIARTIELRPQTRKVLAHLEKRGSITPVEAMVTQGIFSLSSRISELKKAGYRIARELRKDEGGHRYARYSLVRA
jgi:hypothetical protein